MFLLALSATITMALLVQQIGVEHGVERVETHVRSLVLWWHQGTLPYVPSGALPFLQNPYGPTYLGLLTWLEDASSPGSPTGVLGAYGAGRLISVSSLGFMLLAIGLWTLCLIRRAPDHGQGTGLGRAVLIASIAALLPLTTKPMLLFGGLYRVDSLALALAVTGFVLCALAPEKGVGGRVATALAGLAFLAAFATKMTFIAAPAACVAWLWGRQPRRALGLAGFLAIAFPGWIVFMESLTGGAFLASAALGNLPTDIGKSFDMIGRTGLWLFWLIALVQLGPSILSSSTAELTSKAAGSTAPLSTIPPSTGSRILEQALARPARLYFVISLATAAAFSANPLSSWNYLMEPCAALALSTGELLARATPERFSRARPWLTAHACLSLPLIAFWADGALAEQAHQSRRLGEIASCAAAVDPGRQAAALGSVEAVEALIRRGIPPLVAATSTVEALPEVADLLGRAARQGELDWLFLASATNTDMNTPTTPWPTSPKQALDGDNAYPTLSTAIEACATHSCAGGKILTACATPSLADAFDSSHRWSTVSEQ